MGVSTQQVSEPFFRFAARSPLNIAPERSEKLAAEIFGSGEWRLLPSTSEANFYAIPADKAVYLSYAGLASLWCVAYAAFHVADEASRRQRDARQTDQVHIDITAEFLARKSPQHIAYAKALFRKDQERPAPATILTSL